MITNISHENILQQKIREYNPHLLQHSMWNREIHLQANNQPTDNLIPFQLAFSCFLDL